MKHIVITGASSGIGAATARRLDSDDHRLSLGARRSERLSEVAGPEAFRHPLDVTDEGSVEAFLAAAEQAHGPIDILINNAGLARGTEKIVDADGVAWREMVETNVMGVLHVTRRVVGGMVARGSGHVVMIGSVAGHETYETGSVYCGTKRMLRSITEALRYETLGSGVRVTSVDPGMVDTEFSLVRFRGDRQAADAVYSGTRPLTGEDVADCVAFAISRPAHVNLDTILVMPTDQASPKRVWRGN